MSKLFVVEYTVSVLQRVCVAIEAETKKEAENKFRECDDVGKLHELSCNDEDTSDEYFCKVREPNAAELAICKHDMKLKEELRKLAGILSEFKV